MRYGVRRLVAAFSCYRMLILTQVESADKSAHSKLLLVQFPSRVQIIEFGIALKTSE
jgi:hypothetical protein